MSTREIHGRAFHNTDSNYNLPCDDEEHARLNVQHEAIKLMTGSNCLAPLHKLPRKLRNILDLCCGSGQWVVEMATEFPEAEVIGTDISIPSISAELPPNCKFMRSDVLKPLPFPDESFDLVQMRIVPSVSKRTFIMREIGRVLRNDGFIIFVEPDECYSQALQGTRPAVMVEVDRLITLLPHSAPDSKHTDDAEDMMPVRQSWSIGPILADMIRASKEVEGHEIFCNVEYKSLELPLGPWPTDERLKRVGKLMAVNQVAVLDGFRPSLLDHKVVGEDDLHSLRAALADEMKNTGLELVARFWFAWGQRRSRGRGRTE